MCHCGSEGVRKLDGVFHGKRTSSGARCEKMGADVVLNPQRRCRRENSCRKKPAAQAWMPAGNEREFERRFSKIQALRREGVLRCWDSDGTVRWIGERRDFQGRDGQGIYGSEC